MGDPSRKPRPAGRGVLPQSPALRRVAASLRGGRLAGTSKDGGTRPALGNLTPTGAPGPPAYLPPPGGGWARGLGGLTPALRQERTKALREEARPLSPPRVRQPAAPARGGESRRRFPPPVPGQTAGIRGSALAARARAPACRSHLQSWSPQCDRVCPRLLETLFPSRPYRELAGSRAGRSRSVLSVAPELLRLGGGAGLRARQGRGGRWAAPSPHRGPRAGPRSPAQRTAHARS